VNPQWAQLKIRPLAWGRAFGTWGLAAGQPQPSPGDGRVSRPSRYSCRHRARPNIPPYIWFPYWFVYICRGGPAWSMALA
jgi:hypothetical protein